MSKDSHLRSLIKGISWRALGTLDTLILSYIFTGNIKVAAAIGGTEVLTKVILFYFHERAWNMVPPGRLERIFSKKSNTSPND